jgi:hypothetical protein
MSITSQMIALLNTISGGAPLLSDSQNKVPVSIYAAMQRRQSSRRIIRQKPGPIQI